MSSSIKSKTYHMQLRSTRKRRYNEKNMTLKPFGFCCSIDKFDPLTEYNNPKSLHKSLLMSVHRIHESPTLKFQAQFADSFDSEQKKRNPKTKLLDIGDRRHKMFTKQRQFLSNIHGVNHLYKLHNPHNDLHSHIRAGSSRDDLTDQHHIENLHDKQAMHFRRGPLQWHLEDEVAFAKNIMWEQKQKLYNKEMDRNIRIGKQKYKLFMEKEVNTYPRWYQDFSINQMKNLMMLQCVMHKDCEEMVTGRTQRTLIGIGITSTFFVLAPDVIQKLHGSHNCNAIEFLREIYKILTGNYFEEEGYRKVYDCNERIILSAIAFLTLPEAVIELHERLPPVIMPKLPPKPAPPTSPVRQKMGSPYEEDLFMCPDWATYYNRLQHWQKQCELIPIPNIILPPRDCILRTYQNTEIDFDIRGNISSKFQNFSRNNQHNTSIEKEQEKNISTNTSVKLGKKMFANTSMNDPSSNLTNNPIKEKQKASVSHKKKYDIDNKDEKHKQLNLVNSTINTEEHAFDIPQLPNGSKVFDFTINGISEQPGPVEYKICGVLQPPQPNKKSWLGEKHAHYIISGAADDPPTCPVTYEMTGVANVTPTNSNERFFAVLKLGDGDKKIYPSGRENLSPKWQEWLQNADEEFRGVEREANRLIKSIEAITRLVFPGPTCDSCCSCRQTRKSYLKAKETKSPYFVIDTIAEDNKKNKCIVGSMAMHSPAPTPPESTVNLLEYIASEDVLQTNVLINGVTNEKGETQYFISGVKKDIVRVPGRVVERPPPRPPRNVPACVCAIQQIFNKGLSSNVSHDHIPWTKEDGLCFGKKFRPDESPAFSCKMYPGDKSCRRNPFMQEIIKLKRRAERAKQKALEDASSKEKKMYSIADFQPCGDEHGMGICGGPWGALHTLTPEELAEQERLRKEILKGPPCGIRPGRAVCEGPFGERIPLKLQVGIEEIPGEFDEEDLEDEEEKEVKPQKAPDEVKKKEKKRDKKCHMSPESIAVREKVVEKKVEKFIPDPTYPGYDDPWNIFRTAPSEKESETDFKKLLKLSSPKLATKPVETKPLVNEYDEVQPFSPQKDVSKSITKKDNAKVQPRDSRKKSPDPKQGSLSAEMLRKRVSEKLRSDKKIIKKKPKLNDKGGAQEPFPKSAKTEEILDEAMGSEIIDNKRGDKKSLQTKGRKNKMINEKTMSSRNLKKRSEFKQTNENTTSKFKLEKTGSFHAKSNKKFNVKSKRDDKIILRKSNDNETRVSEKISTRHGKLNKKSKRRSNNTRNIEIDKRDREKVKIKKLNRKQILSASTDRKKINKSLNSRNLSVKRDKKKDVQIVQDSDIDPRKQILNLKAMLTSSELYPHDVKPVDLPEEPPRKCTLEYDDIEDTNGSIQIDKESDTQLPSKGPCGWKTKSEQQLPTKKTLVYLTEPDYPPETIPVRPGGKPCVCRENRNKKKVLLYNIGGFLGGKKDDQEAEKLLRKKKDEVEKKMQVIDGVIYYTPPPSPRRSDEYVPEYDLYESPYDMCLSKRKHSSLKFLKEHSGPKNLLLKALKHNVSCGCNEYVDEYGNQTTDREDEEKQTIKEFDKTRQTLIEAKSQKERWKLALRDTGLIDYFTRCRDSMPCWLKCNKFYRVGCKLPRPRLKIKRPVCECKYERKILEQKEEKMKWKERRQRLKSLKKQPFMNIVDTSKPVVVDTKLMISGVKRIPKKDEYVDDVKYCITGVSENYTELPPEPIMGGVQMSTPIHTPEPSIEELPCVCLHRHWSPTNIPPGPLPTPEEIMLAEKKRRQKAAEEAYKQIYAPLEIYDTHGSHSCKETCNPNSVPENDESIENSSKNITDNETKTNVKNPVKQTKQQLRNKNKLVINNPVMQEKPKKDKDVRNEPNVQKTSYNPRKPKYKRTETNAQKSSYNPRKPEYKQIETNVQNNSYVSQKPDHEEIETSLEKTLHNSKKSWYKEITMKSNTEKISDKENNENSDDTEVDLMTIAQNELKKMATEGFLFAKLPKCFLMPQLQYWLMYRQGIALDNTDKDNSVHKSVMMWNVLDVRKSSKVEPPSLKLTKVELRELTFDRAEEMKEKIEKKKEIFYSQVRKERVLYSRSMWNTVDYGKFPSMSFKEAYFTYMANREADGHVYKPWLSYEVCDVTN